MDHIYLHALSALPGIGNKTLQTLIKHFGSGEAVWHASENDILYLADIDQNAKHSLISGRSANINTERINEEFAREGISLIAWNDTHYPPLLKEIPDAPFLLYVRGNAAFDTLPPLIALVGSRKHTSYGTQAAYRLSEDLVRAGFGVVSGLAFGIDAMAHRAALEASGTTIAVLGSGVSDRDITPRSHVQLGRAITASGALISEYAPDTPVFPGMFPARNRIIAGMTLGTIVIEAAEKSGSLITAYLALDYGREVFAVPGSIFSPASAGTNVLIKNGAKIVRCIQDILEELPTESIPHPSSSAQTDGQPIGLSPDESAVFRLLSHEPIHVDKLLKAATLGTATLSSTLTMLELKGLVRDIGGMKYVKTRPDSVT